MYTNSDIYSDSKTLTINLSETPQIPWNHLDTSTNVIETFASAVFGNLIDSQEYNSNSNSFNLIDNYSCKDKKCSIQLKKNIKFHNGRNVTAFDIEFSFTRFLTQERENNFAFTILNDIEGIEKLNPAKQIEKNGISYFSGMLNGLKIIDNYNLTIDLKQNNPHIFEKLNSGRLPIVPIEELKSDYIHWKNLPVGFGRYKVVEVDLKNYEFILENMSNENIPQYIRIIFSNQDIGDLRILSHMSDSQFDGDVVFPSVYVNGGFLFNFSTKLGANENFRMAISLALDREKIANTAESNELIAEDQMLPLSSVLKKYRKSEAITSQNISLAKELLKKVPKELWENKILNVHSFWTLKKNFNELKYIQEIKKQLSEVGLNLVFHNTDFNYTKFNRIDENVLWWTGFDTLTNDPNRNFGYFMKGSFFNHIYPENNSQFEILFNESAQQYIENPESTQKLSAYFKDNNYMVVILNVKKRMAYKKERVEFIEPQNNSVRIELWKIKLKNNNIF
ncbi:ABC transporter substrate-binding protein [Fluviispira multicolorata]|uniref:Solute-binding protein family 5 domain-containing protein n=1 Tax=Fluviispira multicolorata TaxID=2654512 RepID=A0A833JB95_9BACT|nr:ABC transporter substrate-binding protein [Fluviispira multicolorata]KAB8029147.1 hypothetical protein GCL57_11455 [Fluviispira multicolorata]